MLLIVNLKMAGGRDGAALQLARSTSPGSYRSRSVHNSGSVSGSSANLKREKRKRKEKIARTELVNVCKSLAVLLLEYGVYGL